MKQYEVSPISMLKIKRGEVPGKVTSAVLKVNLVIRVPPEYTVMVEKLKECRKRKHY